MIQRTYTNFSGGVNKKQGPVIFDMGEAEAFAFCEDSYNWENSEEGLIKRPGYDNAMTTAISGTPAITGIFEFSRSSGSDQTIVCAGTSIYTVSGGTRTEIQTGQTTGKYYQALQWVDNSGNEIIILMNGTDTPIIWDGTTASTMSPTDPDTIWDGFKPAFAAVFRGRVFYGGDPSLPNRVITPRPGTYDNFDNSTSEVDAFEIDPGFGGIVTGLKPLTDNFLVIYKENCIRRLSGTAPFASVGAEPFEISVVTDAFGCIAPRSIVGNEIEHYFMAEDGLRQLRPIQSYGDIDPQQPTYLVQELINGLNFTRSVIVNACATFDKSNKQIWLALPNGASTTNNMLLNFDVITRTVDFRGQGDITASYLAYFGRTVYHGDYAGQVYSHGDDNNYNGSAITAIWQGKLIAHNGIGVLKCYRKVMLFADADSGGDVVVQWTILQEDQESALSQTETVVAGSLWDTAVWDQDVWATGVNKVFHIKNLGKGNAIAFRFTNASASQRVKIRQIDLYYEAFGNHRG